MGEHTSSDVGVVARAGAAVTPAVVPGRPEPFPEDTDFFHRWLEHGLGLYRVDEPLVMYRWVLAGRGVRPAVVAVVVG